MADHLLENILEEDCRGHLTVDFPEVLLALERQLLVEGICRLRSPKRLKFCS